MKAVRWILFSGTMVLCGCHTARNVAVTSFHVIDAPANYVRRHIDGSSSTATTASVASDSVTPGRTVPVAPNNRETQRQIAASTKPSPGETPHVSREVAAEKPKTSPSPAPRSVANAPSQYPTAKSVPGKPGYVFSPFDSNGGYVDVNGFPSGSKVKDPYSGKIFLVP